MVTLPVGTSSGSSPSCSLFLKVDTSRCVLYTESLVLANYLAGCLGTWKEHGFEFSENKFGQNPETLGQNPVIYNHLDGTWVPL